MDKIVAQNGGFPATTGTWNFLTKSIADAIKLLSLAVSKAPVVLDGVVKTDNVVSDGAIIYDGEVYPFVGGAYNSTVIIFENVSLVPYNEDVNNDNQKDLKTGYVRRYAKCGVGGVASFAFTDLKRIGDLVPATASEVADDNNTGKFFDMKTLLTRTPSKTKRALVRAATDNEINNGTKDDVYVSAKSLKENDIILFAGEVRADGTRLKYSKYSFTSSRVAGSTYRINHNIGNTNYAVVGAGVGRVNIKVSMGTRTSSYFLVSTSDDATLNDSDFSFLVFKF